MQRFLKEFDAAVSTFRLKYNGLPGDLTNSEHYGLTVPTITDYLGDDKIGISALGARPAGSSWHTNAMHESFFFWLHLLEAELINYTLESSLVPGEGSPEIKLSGATMGDVLTSRGGGWGIAHGAAYTTDILSGVVERAINKHVFFINSGTVAINHFPIYGAILPINAAAIDYKIDDGIPLTGEALAFSSNTICLTTAGCGGSGSQYLSTVGFRENLHGIGNGGSNTPSICVRTDTAIASYNIENDTPSPSGWCGLILQASF